MTGRDSERFRVCIVCSGNICRSPMGEVVVRQRLMDAQLAERVLVDSAGTGDWHVGEPADPRTVAALAERGYDGSRHRAAWFDPDFLHSRELILVADHGHLAEIHRLAEDAGAETNIRLLRSFDPAAGPNDQEVADPYFGDASDFRRCLDEVEGAAPGVVEFVRSELS